MRKPMRLSGRLYFFPAFLPLAELLPWLLTLIGAVAGVAGFSLPAFWARHRRLILSFTASCLIVALGVYIHALPDREVRSEGTRAITAENLPRPLFYNTANIPAAPTTQRQSVFKHLWSHSSSMQILATPVITENLMIFGGYGGSTEAVFLSDGTPIWSLKQKAPVFAISQDANGTVYSSEGLHDTASASLSAINPINGTVIWQREFLGHLEENAAFYDNGTKMLVSAGPGGLWALKTANGKIIWHQSLGHIDSKPLVTGNIVYVPAQISEKNHKTIFYALDASNGKILWSLPQPGQPWGSPLLDKSGNVILTTTGEGQIGIAKGSDSGWAQAISKTGKLLWEIKLPSMALQPSAYIQDKDIIIHSQKNGEITALNVSDGSVAWHTDVGGTLNTSGTLINGFAVPLLAVTTYDGLFSIIRATDGAILTRQKINGSVNAAPVVHDDVVYVFSAYNIYAFAGVHTLAEQP